MLKSSDSRQLNFVFADNSRSGESMGAKKADVSAGQACLLLIAEGILATEADAPGWGREAVKLCDSQCEEPDVWPTSPVL